jgi:hypothetical protein
VDEDALPLNFFYRPVSFAIVSWRDASTDMDIVNIGLSIFLYFNLGVTQVDTSEFSFINNASMVACELFKKDCSVIQYRVIYFIQSLCEMLIVLEIM